MEKQDVIEQATHAQGLNARLVLFTRWLLNTALFVAGDIFALTLASFLAGKARHQIMGGYMTLEWTWFITFFWIMVSLGTKLTPGWGLGVVESLRRQVMLLFVLFAGSAAILFLTKTTDSASRFTITMAFLLAGVLIPLIRNSMKKLLLRYQLWGMQVVIYGHKEKARELMRLLFDTREIGYVPVGVYLAEDDLDDTLYGVPVLDSNEDPYPYAHGAILLEPSTLRDTRPEFSEAVSLRYRTTLVLPEFHRAAPSLWVTPRDLGGVAGLEISTNLLDQWSRFLKQISEVFIVLLLLPFILILLLVLGLLIFLSDFHSPFFVQERVGFKGKTFRMWKFRTMRPDTEKVLEEKLESDPAFRNHWELHFKSPQDPRITRIGKLLRRSSLDEIPQIINVLKGDMALIGPRPLPLYHDAELPESVRNLRTKVLPGITGLWQVSGRSDIGNDGIVRWDAYYVQNWSIWLDIVILVRTLRAVLGKEGAY